MKKILLFVAFIAVVFAVSDLEARKHRKKHKDIEISGYIKPTLRGAKVAVAYISITNKRENDIMLKTISSDVAGKVEIHDHKTSPEGMSQMIKLDYINIPSGKTVSFEPGGMHLMLYELEEELIKGRKYKFSFFFDLGNEETQIIKKILEVKK